MFPRSAVVGIALLPWVVEFGSELAPSRRLRHVAFVGDVAFGARGNAGRVGVPFTEPCYARVSATVKRILRDVIAGGGWNEWEARYLIQGCNRVIGRLRSGPSTASVRAAAEPISSDLEHQTAAWLLGMSGGLPCAAPCHNDVLPAERALDFGEAYNGGAWSHAIGVGRA